MSLWRLEWLRLTRSPRGFALVAVYAVFGALGPVVARYIREIVAHVESGVQITVPDPLPKDGIANFVSQAGQTGVVVTVAVAAGAMTFDARRGLSIFLRTRTTGIWQLVAPRFVLSAAAAATAYAVGTVVAWYETALLLGAPSAYGVLGGLLCGAAYLVFCVAVTTAAAGVVRTTLGVVGSSLAVLVALPVLGLVEAVHDWLPSTLLNAPVELVSGTAQLSRFLPTLAVAAAGSALLVAFAVRRLAAREV